ncbi:Ras-related protein Rab-22A [Tritrichomonas foetus]|uniref:Ras-related protein Rab-22A n=1 Tax=Tritrichomonas foetus TaxID=1144522 RepID=A0A1J4KMB3_9EUKA|nr:Ras-related protein Rab-22A [Tritrichomonas foetus]|eukprot:OHT12441.1 Ras-related protein Rab-22A [Tritrichomonas foetus]
MSDILKVVILGDSMTGKMTLITRWAEERILQNPNPTLGAAFKSMIVPYDNENYTLHFWDTAGQEVYRSTMPLYCRSTSSAIVVFDITSRKSFESLACWIDLLKDTAGDDVPFIIVGNKCDLEQSDRDVSYEEAFEFAKKYETINYETSAITGKNVEEMFIHISHLAIKRKITVSESETKVIDLKPAKASNEKKCC